MTASPATPATPAAAPASGEAVLLRAARIRAEGAEPAAAPPTGMLVVDGRVAALGDADELAAAHPGARVDDFGDAVITPGLVDGHMHPIWGLSLARGAALGDCESYDELLEALRAEAAGLADGEWLLGWGLEPRLLPEGPVANDFLHEAVGADRPAYITMFDAHSAVVSRAALEAAGVEGPESFADGGGIVEREDAAGRAGLDRLSGHVLEFGAIERMQRHVPQSTIAEQAARLHGLLSEMAATGLTGAYVPDAQPRDLVEVLDAIEAEGELPMRLRISPWCTPEMDDDDLEALVDRLGRGGRRWRLEGVKLFIDGTIDGGTAWLEQPDRLGDGAHGFWHDPERYARRVRRLHELGVPTITHAIGDRGVRFVVETLADLPANGVQHRIDHLELVADDVIDRIGELGIAVCVQPSHCTLFTHPEGLDTWSQRLGEPRNQQGWKTRRYLEAGAVEALGSDWPVAPYDPRTIIADAQLRHPHDRDTPPIHPEQALTAEEALTGYTSMVPRSVGLDGGGLAIGDDADCTVWAADPVAGDPREVARIPIIATAIAGALVVDAR